MTVPGQELQPLCSAAEVANVFIGANVYEFDPIWPGRFFNTTFLIGPDGELVTKYRRIHSSVTPSPHDFLDEYIKEVGWDAEFPVADTEIGRNTEIGRIGMLSCGEIRKPEVARQFAM